MLPFIVNQCKEDSGDKATPFHLNFRVAADRLRDVTFEPLFLERENAGGAETC
jgi:hypothetical protein